MSSRPTNSGRLHRERATIRAMIDQYCRAHHGEHVGEPPSGDAPAHEMPAHEMPAHEMPAHEMPAHEMPAHEMPGAGTPSGGHSADQRPLCGECRELEQYAMKRLDCCPYGEEKPTCAKCPIHCYRPEMRQRVREVMRWAGPRMMWRHPVLAVRHLIDGRRGSPPRAT